MEQERVIDCLQLENGLSLYFVDLTRSPIAGRCQVQLLIRVPVEPTEDCFREYDDPSLALSEFASLAGPGPVEYRNIKIRNFVDMKDVEVILNEMKDEYIRTNLQYLNKFGFRAGFIRKRYEELRKEAALRRAQSAV